MTASAATAATVRELFAVAQAHAGPARYTLDVTDDPIERPATAPSETYDTLLLWRDGDDLVVDSGAGVFAFADAAGIRVAGDVSGQRFAVGLRRAMHHALSHVLSLAGRVVVHGAAVARDGRAVLLLGSTGSGKSTCAYLAGAAGWDVLADDLVALWPGGDDLLAPTSVLATGVPRALAVPSDVLGGDGGDDGDALTDDPRGRRRMSHALFAEPCRVGAVAIVRHGSGAGSLRPLAAAELMTFVIGSAPAAGHPRVARQSFVVASALTATPTWELLTADTPARRTAEVPRQLDSVLRHAT